MTLVLFILGAAGLIMTKVFTKTKEIRENVPMMVEMKNGLSEGERDAIAERIGVSDLVREVKFVSKEELLNDEEFKRAFGADIEGLFDENPLLDHYEITLSAKSSDKAALDEFVETIRQTEGVEHVSYPEGLIEELHPALDVTQLIMLVFGGALLLISFILLNNTVLLDVYAQRELINTLKAVGATRWFIMRPFIIRSLVQGAIAGVVASALLVGALYGLNHIVPGLGLLPKWAEIGIGTGAIVLLGVIVAVVCTLPIVNHFVNMKSNKIQIC